jgi:hypothetical protein
VNAKEAGGIKIKEYMLYCCSSSSRYINLINDDHVLHPNVSKTTSIVLDYKDLFSFCTFVTHMKVIHDINQDKTFC